MAKLVFLAQVHRNQAHVCRDYTDFFKAHQKKSLLDVFSSIFTSLWVFNEHFLRAWQFLQVLKSFLLATSKTHLCGKSVLSAMFLQAVCEQKGKGRETEVHVQVLSLVLQRRGGRRDCLFTRMGHCHQRPKGCGSNSQVLSFLLGSTKKASSERGKQRLQLVRLAAWLKNKTKTPTSCLITALSL